MRVQKLLFRCHCGGEAIPTSHYITEQFTIIFYGICRECDQRVEIQTALTALYKMSKDMREADTKPVKPPLALPAQSDSSFLHEMGIGGSLEQ